jgi:hypothetical protein
VIRQVTVTRLVCPAELDQVLGPRPVPAEGAVIRHNAEGGQFLDGLGEWGDRAAALFLDAQADCDRQVDAAAPPAAARVVP